MDAEKKKTQHPLSELPKVNFWEILPHFKPFFKGLKRYATSSFLLSLTIAAMASLFPLGSKIVIDFILGKKLSPDLAAKLSFPSIGLTTSQINYYLTTTNGFIVLFCIFGSLYALSNIIQKFCLFHLRQQLTANVTHGLFSKVLSYPIDFHSQIPEGYLTSRVFQDSTSLERFISVTLPNLATQILRLIFGLFILTKINWPMTMVCLIAAPFYLGINFFFYKPIRRVHQKNAELNSLTSSLVQNSITGIEVIKSFSLLEKQSDSLTEMLSDRINNRQKGLKLQLLTHYLTRIIQITSFLIILWLGITNIQKGNLSLGDFAAFLSYIGFLTTPITTIAFFYLSIQPTLVSFKRIFQLLSADSENESGNKLTEKINKIEIKSLDFAYGSNDQIFDNHSQSFEPGKPTIISWLSGKGKTTLAKLLLKFVSPINGEILINETPIGKISGKNLRDKIAYVSQNTFLFADSIKNNLLVATPNATDEEINEALKKVCAYDFISKLPGGLDTVLSDNGKNLSAGQRQRLSIARALLKKSDVLILDEPFANLDQEKIKQISDNLIPIFKEKTTIILSHKEIKQERQNNSQEK
jgi:ABC-type bacteriocin/lantibiotic exporter with double-glycine peptidase domain